MKEFTRISIVTLAAARDLRGNPWARRVRRALSAAGARFAGGAGDTPRPRRPHHPRLHAGPVRYAGSAARAHVLLMNLSTVTNRIRSSRQREGWAAARLVTLAPMGSAAGRRHRAGRPAVREPPSGACAWKATPGSISTWSGRDRETWPGRSPSCMSSSLAALLSATFFEARIRAPRRDRSISRTPARRAGSPRCEVEAYDAAGDTAAARSGRQRRRRCSTWARCLARPHRRGWAGHGPVRRPLRRARSSRTGRTTTPSCTAPARRAPRSTTRSTHAGRFPARPGATG